MTKSKHQYARIAARREIVRELARQGISQRDIATQLGVNRATILNDVAVLTKPPIPCIHCDKYPQTKARGLCWRCYQSLDIRNLYPAPNADIEGDGEDAPLLPRQIGEAPHRCLWCSDWKCEEAMRLCGGCQREYEMRAVGMPLEAVSGACDYFGEPLRQEAI